MKRFAFITILLLSLSGSIFAQEMNVGSYNLRYDNQTDSIAGNGWRVRYPVIAQLIKFNDLDVFGVQEGFYHMLNNLADSLPGYKWIGEGRDGGQKGEHSAIYYKEAKFKLLKSGNFWLSATNTESPNVGWDAALTRVCTWAQFKEIKTGFVFNFFNVHMDHVGVLARSEGAKLIMAKMKEMTGGKPTILTGDFNANQDSGAYLTLNESGLLKDSYVLSPVKLANGPTFNGFKIGGNNSNARIDHIFVTKQFKVKRYGILTQTFNGKLPSDHYPVVINVSY
ncbi:endonuclease/exonuclease/phosphatase family protein [Pedobacter frigiditerrae]|uniref:Endonuclease/exonuclease/phosphatase family protein n=1 Tax=Pedobacter frigiditerrae TaxID=2530452 RepID=A0A4R0N1G3_9SPHI|nr:endonuclease/exonuclease/phosphatase family protein [Pedobacter frigiditerrae]TCC93619.1 endonuclease/exonuclease/phosphatase family protein [Pedobacter frigiditerrae]